MLRRSAATALLGGLVLLAAPLAAQAPSDLPDGLLLVANKPDATLRIIEPSTGAELARLPTGVGPHEIGVSPDGRLAVVTDYGQATPGTTLTVVDVGRREVARTLDLDSLRRPHGIRFLDDRHVIVTVEQNQALAIVDVVDGEVERVLRTGQSGTHMVALSPDRSTAYTGDIGSGTVTIVDIDTGGTRHLEVGDQAEAITVTPDGGRIWVGSNSGDQVWVLDAADGTVLERLPTLRMPIRVEATPDGRHVLVTTVMGNAMQIFDAATHEQLGVVRFEAPADRSGTLPGGSTAPIGTLPTPDGRFAFVALNATAQVAIVDLERREVVGYLDVGPGPDGLGWVAF